jgi:NAD(P)-dependent dehydrogenase (short-subunit alcohol dehydrogenase family)
VVVIGGTRGLGYAVATAAVAKGYSVTITGRSADAAQHAAATLGGACIGRQCDLNDWSSIKRCFDEIATIDHFVLVAVERDGNEITAFRPEDALRTSAAKTVGYATSVHHALDEFSPHGSVVMFGGLSAWRPFPGTTTISISNAAIVGLMNSLATQIAPVRINTVTPGVVDNPGINALELVVDGGMRIV